MQGNGRGVLAIASMHPKGAAGESKYECLVSSPPEVGREWGQCGMGRGGR